MAGRRCADFLLARRRLWITDCLFQLQPDQERFNEGRHYSLPYQLRNVNIRQCCGVLFHRFSGIYLGLLDAFIFIYTPTFS